MFRLLHGLFHCHWEFFEAQRKRDCETVYASFVVYNTEKRSQMCEIHLYEAALRGPAGGECLFL